ncbi:MAG TPA: hypothetical protein DCY79_19105, partial [Planctomycetaceae bacterium]|nr:hypothetical protein [Planctomycetaceae bacterium]
MVAHAAGPKRLIDQEPYDSLAITTDGDLLTIDVFPMKRPVVRDKTRNAKFEVRKLDEPDAIYEVYWNKVEGWILFEDRVLKQANQYLIAKKYDEAYDFYAYLLRRYPKTKNLALSIKVFLYDSAGDAVASKRYDEALAILEELYQLDSAFVDPRSDRAAKDVLNRVVGIVVQGYVGKDDIVSAQKIIRHFVTSYGDGTFSDLTAEKNKLDARAAKLRDQAEAQMNDEKLTAAFETVQEMMRVWPDVERGREVATEVFRRYPRVRVGVSQLASTYDSSSIDNWSARRVGRLLERRLFEFQEAGSTGGTYVSAFGDYELAEDYRRVTIQLNRNAGGDGEQPVTGLDLSQRLRDMANVRSESYSPVWGSIMKSVSVEDVFRVHVDLRRPHVLPYAALQMPLTGVGIEGTALSAGPFVVANASENEVLHRKNDAYIVGNGNQPAEVVERVYTDRGLAVAALKKSEVDVLDRVWPATATALRREPGIVVQRYAHPTLHMLVPNYENVYLKRPSFRSALLYAIPRQAILDQLVLGKTEQPGCQVVTGPFPIGFGDDDPLSYGYNTTIAPRNYDPRTSVLLKKLTENELSVIYGRRDEKVPELEPLVLGHPPDQLIRLVCEAIVAQLKKVEIECTLKELPPGASTDPTGECDLVYLEVAMWEPVIDAERLLGGGRLITDTSQYLD